MQVAMKKHELTINISPSNRSQIVTNTTFFSMDVATGKKIIYFVNDERPVDLTDAHVILGFEFVGTASSKIIDSDDGSVVIENPENGVCHVVLPNHLYDYEGQVLVHVYIDYEDGRSLDCGVIVTEFEKSWLERELAEMQPFYIQRFEDLKRKILARVEELEQTLGNVGSGNVGGGGAFDISMLTGSGILQAEVLDVTNQTMRREVQMRERTDTGTQWSFIPMVAYEGRNFWSAFELTEEKRRNKAIVGYVNRNRWTPMIMPVSLNHRPKLIFYIRDKYWNSKRMEVDYDVTVAQTVDQTQTYVLSGTFYSFESEEEKGAKIHFRWAVSGVLDFYDDERIYAAGVISERPSGSGSMNGHSYGSIIMWTDDSVPEGFALQVGYFETEEMSWTGQYPVVHDVISANEFNFRENNRIDADILYPLMLDLSSWEESANFILTFRASVGRLRLGQSKRIILTADENRLVIHKELEAEATLLREGISIRILGDRSFPSDWWDVPYEWQTPRIKWAEVTRKL